MASKNRHSGILFLIIVILMIRGVVLFFQPATFEADPDNYRHLAENLSINKIYGNSSEPTAFRPPLYPLLLAGAIKCANPETLPIRGMTADQMKQSRWHEFLLSENMTIALIHWILGIATVFMTYLLGIRLKLSHFGASLAALLVGLDPILLQQSRLVMTETLAVFFAVLVLLLLVKYAVPGRSFFWPFLPGLLLGCAALCRPAFLALAALAIIPLFIFRGTKGFTFCGSVARILCFLLGVLIPLAPWTVRNYREFEKPVFATTHGGYTLLLANNTFLYDFQNKHFPWETAWNGDEFHRWWEGRVDEALTEKKITPGSRQAELFQDDLARSEAIAVIKERTGEFWRSMAIRIGNLWQPLPYQTSDQKVLEAIRYCIGGFYALELLLMLIGIGILIYRRRTKAQEGQNGYSLAALWIWPILLILSVQLPHLLYWTNMRMRAPLVIVIALFCGILFTEFKKTCAEKDEADINGEQSVLLEE